MQEQRGHYKTKGFKQIYKCSRIFKEIIMLNIFYPYYQLYLMEILKIKAKVGGLFARKVEKKNSIY